ncbi:chromate transporter [bacterium]|nr:chromate transporter [bacterium]
MLLISSCTFGGGFVIVAFIQEKFVDKLKWLETEEMLDIISAAQSAPGPVAANTSVMLGYKLAGIPGALLSLLATSLPPLLIMILAAEFFDRLSDNRFCQIFFKYSRLAIAAVTINVTWNLVLTVKSKLGASALFAGAVIALMMVFLKIPTAYYIVFGGLFGYCFYKNPPSKDQKAEGVQP